MKTKAPIKGASAYFGIIIATAIWGAALPIVKLTQQYIPPFSFLFLRFLLVGIVMLPVAFIELKATPINKKDYKNLLLLGIFGQASIAFIFWGVKYASTVNTAIISTIAPLLVILAGHHFYNERVNKITQFGIFLATIGTGLIVLEPLLHKNIQETDALLRTFGNLLVVSYNIMFTMYILFSKVVMGQGSEEMNKALSWIRIKPMTSSYSPILSTTLTFYVGLMVIMPFAILENFGLFGHNAFDPQKLTLIPTLGILYMAIMSSIVAYIAYEWSLKKADVSDSAIFGYLGPLFTIPFSYIILKEIPNTYAMFGALVILIGVIIAETYKGKKHTN